MSGLTGSNGFSGARTTSYNEVLVNELNVGGNATITGNLTVNGSISPGTFTNRAVVNIAATLAPTAAQSGTTFVIAPTVAGGPCVTTLPAAAVGLNYRFVIGNTVTAGDTYTWVLTNAADRMFGTVVQALADTVFDTGNTGFMSVATGAPATENTITMNGSTQGGLIGGYLDIVSVADTGSAQNTWYISGRLNTTGTPVTIFS